MIAFKAATALAAQRLGRQRGYFTGPVGLSKKRAAYVQLEKVVGGQQQAFLGSNTAKHEMGVLRIDCLELAASIYRGMNGLHCNLGRRQVAPDKNVNILNLPEFISHELNAISRQCKLQCFWQETLEKNARSRQFQREVAKMCFLVYSPPIPHLVVARWD